MKFEQAILQRITADPELAWLVGGVVLLLVTATITGVVLARRVTGESSQTALQNVHAHNRNLKKKP